MCAGVALDPLLIYLISSNRPQARETCLVFDLLLYLLFSFILSKEKKAPIYAHYLKLSFEHRTTEFLD